MLPRVHVEGRKMQPVVTEPLRKPVFFELLNVLSAKDREKGIPKNPVRGQRGQNEAATARFSAPAASLFLNPV
jgi:hypothetical protein